MSDASLPHCDRCQRVEYDCTCHGTKFTVTVEATAGVHVMDANGHAQWNPIRWALEVNREE